MMTQVLTVEAAGQVFGVPMDAVVETVRVNRDAIAPIGAARALVLRNRTVPVIDLGQALGRDAERVGRRRDRADRRRCRPMGWP